MFSLDWCLSESSKKLSLSTLSCSSTLHTPCEGCELALVYSTKIISSCYSGWYALLPVGFKEDWDVYAFGKLHCYALNVLYYMPNSAFFPRFRSPFSCLNTQKMIKCLRQCQQRCSGTVQVSRALYFVRYLCRVVFIRARMRPICCLGCQPSPSSQQVLCTVLCVTVSAWLVLGEVADCFEFAQ